MIVLRYDLRGDRDEASFTPPKFNLLFFIINREVILNQVINYKLHL